MYIISLLIQITSVRRTQNICCSLFVILTDKHEIKLVRSAGIDEVFCSVLKYIASTISKLLNIVVLTTVFSTKFLSEQITSEQRYCNYTKI